MFAPGLVSGGIDIEHDCADLFASKTAVSFFILRIMPIVLFAKTRTQITFLNCKWGWLIKAVRLYLWLYIALEKDTFLLSLLILNIAIPHKLKLKLQVLQMIIKTHP